MYAAPTVLVTTWANMEHTQSVHKFSLLCLLLSLQVSGNYVPIIRGKYRTHATPGICHSI